MVNSNTLAIFTDLLGKSVACANAGTFLILRPIRAPETGFEGGSCLLIATYSHGPHAVAAPETVCPVRPVSAAKPGVSQPAMASQEHGLAKAPEEIGDHTELAQQTSEASRGSDPMKARSRGSPPGAVARIRGLPGHS
jgi:hypothetical protein